MLGKQLSLLRGNKTQQEVADAIGITRARYAHYETGRNEPDVEILIRLADYYRVSIDYLIGRTKLIKENKSLYRTAIFAEAEKIAKLFMEDPESHKFWMEYVQATPTKRKDFLRTWNVMRELEKKKDD